MAARAPPAPCVLTPVAASAPGLQVLTAYLAKHPDSPVGLNIKACNAFKLFGAEQAEAELAPLVGTTQSVDQVNPAIVRHNLCVFRDDGHLSRKVLPPLLDVVPEARLNLCISYLKSNDFQEAFDLVKVRSAGPGLHRASHGPRDGARPWPAPR